MPESAIQLAPEFLGTLRTCLTGVEALLLLLPAVEKFAFVSLAKILAHGNFHDLDSAPNRPKATSTRITDTFHSCNGEV
jgi:hypothetical protein